MYHEIERHNIGFPTLGNPIDVANAIIRIDDHKELLPEMSTRAASYIREHYSWTSITENNIKHYRAINER